MRFRALTVLLVAIGIICPCSGDGVPEYSETTNGCIDNTPPALSFSPDVSQVKPILPAGSPVSILFAATDYSEIQSPINPGVVSTGAVVEWTDLAQLTALGVSPQTTPSTQDPTTKQRSTTVLSFIAPNTTGTVYLKARATDVFGCSRTATFAIGFQGASANTPPTARIRYQVDGGPITTPTGAAVLISSNSAHSITLDATTSSDPEGAISSYLWTLTGGSGPSLAGASNSMAILSVPAGFNGSVIINLAVRDSQAAQGTASISFNFQAASATPPTARIRYKIGTGGTFADASAPVILNLTGSQTVILDGSTSTDPQSGSLTYSWSKDSSGLTAGTASAVSGTNSSQYSLNFSSAARGNLVVTLTVKDPNNETGTASITFSAQGPIDQLPVARIRYKVDNGLWSAATSELTPIPNDSTKVITLDGTTSSDNEGTIAWYQWTLNDQLAGVALTTATSSAATLTADSGTVGVVSVLLTVKDSANQADTALISFHISAPAAAAPIAKMVVKLGQVVLSDDARLEPGQTITLDASASECRDGGPTTNLVFRWRQVDGNVPRVGVIDSDKPVAQIVVPGVAKGGTELKFELIVSDLRGGRAEPLIETLIVDIAALYFPHIGVGPMPDGQSELRTVVLLVNDTTAKADAVRIEFFTQEGIKFTPLADGQLWGDEPFSIGAMKSRRISFTNPEIQIGWARVRSSTRLFGLVQYQLISSVTAEVKREIGLFSSLPSRKSVSFFDPNDEVAYAIANPGPLPAEIRLSVNVSDPDLDEPMALQLPPLHLGTNKQVAQFVPKTTLLQYYLPGSIVIESDNEVVVTILKTKEFEAFSTLPISITR